MEVARDNLTEPTTARDPAGFRRMGTVSFGGLLSRIADVDGRSLVLLRLGVAVLVMVEAGKQTAALWTPPPDVAAASFPPIFAPAAPATAALPASPAVISLLVLAALSGLLLFIGYRTRVAATLAWLMLTGLAAWHDDPADPANVVLRLLLLWCVLLPVGARFSVDHAARWRPPAKARGQGIVGGGLLVQLALLTVLGPHLLSMQPLAAQEPPPITLTAQAVVALAWLPPVAVQVVDWTVLVALVLLLLPPGGGAIRLIVSLSMFTLHLFLGISVTNHLLPIVLGVMWLAVLPPGAWDAFFRAVQTRERVGVVLWHASPHPPFRYRLIHTFLLLPQAAIRCTRDDVELDLFRRQRNSWIVTDASGYRHLRFRAVGEVLRASPWAWPLAPLMHFGPVETVGDWLFDLWQRWRPTLARLAPPLDVNESTDRPALAATLLPLAVLLLIGTQLWLLLPAADEPLVATLHQLVRAALLR